MGSKISSIFSGPATKALPSVAIFLGIFLELKKKLFSLSSQDLPVNTPPPS